MNERYRILIVDDDPHIVKLLSRYVEREGWEAFSASDGESALEFLDEHGADLVVLDIMMPRLDGMRACEEIGRTSKIPVIMLTAKDHESDKIRGLTAGADDYITKPFSADEAIARIRAVLRRARTVPSPAGGSSGGILTAGPIALDRDRFEVKIGGRGIRLTAKEFELLSFFMESPGMVFTKEQLLRAVWKQEYGSDENTVMVHIRRLRKKIEAEPDNPEFLKTVWGIGYRLEAGK